ncbi:hypothetical protein Tco_0248264 [Tanacetum coccineum]|uniref:Uncharacterized protein n=1 Tax=Tanacetum coccineum TaxID=301880 RepID=A0ABQ4Z1R2_9ASTR
MSTSRCASQSSNIKSPKAPLLNPLVLLKVSILISVERNDWKYRRVKKTNTLKDLNRETKINTCYALAISVQLQSYAVFVWTGYLSFRALPHMHDARASRPFQITTPIGIAKTSVVGWKVPFPADLWLLGNFEQDPRRVTSNSREVFSEEKLVVQLIDVVEVEFPFVLAKRLITFILDQLSGLLGKRSYGFFLDSVAYGNPSPVLCGFDPICPTGTFSSIENFLNNEPPESYSKSRRLFTRYQEERSNFVKPKLLNLSIDERQRFELKGLAAPYCKRILGR